MAGEGGAIWNGGTITKIATSLFVRNMAWDGGAIYNAGTVETLETSIFTQNDGLDAGGAIYNAAGGTMTLITTSIFHNNRAGTDGGVNSLSARCPTCG